MLNVKFATRRTGKFSFTVTAEAPRAKPDEAVSVPVFAPQNVERHEAKVGLAIHVSLKANTVDKGDLREEDIRNLGGIPIKDPARRRSRSASAIAASAKPAQVQFELRKPRVSAEVLALLEVREALIRHSWTLAYNVEYAGVNEFAIEVPKAIADDLQIEGANIKERTKTDATDAQASRPAPALWRVTLQDKVLGPYELRLTHDTARGEQKQGAVAQVALTEIKPLNLFRETGQVAVIKDGNLEFTKTDAKGLELIDPKELHGSLQRDGIFLAYKYSAHPLALHARCFQEFLPRRAGGGGQLRGADQRHRRGRSGDDRGHLLGAQQRAAILQHPAPDQGGQSREAAQRRLRERRAAAALEAPGQKRTAHPPARAAGRQRALSRCASSMKCRARNPASASAGAARSTSSRRKLGDTEVLQTKWTLYLPQDYRYVKFDGAMREAISRRGWDRLSARSGFSCRGSARR